MVSKAARQLTLITFFTLTLAGCLALPLDYYKDYSRENITESSPAEIVAGVTTRGEILMKLGEPDRSSQDETEMWYVATKVKGGILAGYSGSEIIIHYIHAINFDKNGVVTTIRLLKSSGIEKSEIQSNELDYRDIGLSYKPEPHFSMQKFAMPPLRD